MKLKLLSPIKDSTMLDQPVTMNTLQAFEIKWMKKLSNLETAISNETDTRRERVSKLKTSYSTLETNNTNLRERVTSLETNSIDLKATNTKLQVANSNLRERVTNLEMFATHLLSVLVEMC